MNLVVKIRKTNPSCQKPPVKTNCMHIHINMLSNKNPNQLRKYLSTELSIVFFSCRDLVNYVAYLKNMIIRVSEE